jgi:alpha-ribazole phosphatase
MNIYLIRHTEVYNPNKLCYGQSEIPLAENFTAHFDWLQDSLASSLESPVAYYSSPFRRCSKLADYLSNGNFITDERIAELHFGAWEMQAWDKIKPKELEAWMADFVNYKIDKGENFIELYERSTAFFEDILATANKDIMVVTHAGVIRSILAYVLDFPLENAFNLEINYSSITKIVHQPEFNSTKVAFVNRTERV